jgi:hypothetical protein
MGAASLPYDPQARGPRGGRQDTAGRSLHR